MIVTDVFTVRTRGPVAYVTYDADVLPVAGKSRLRRRSDGATWLIRGVDKWALNKLSWLGCPLGFLLPDNADVAPGDDVLVLEEAT